MATSTADARRTTHDARRTTHDALVADMRALCQGLAAAMSLELEERLELLTKAFNERVDALERELAKRTVERGDALERIVKQVPRMTAARMRRGK